jgi:hypothetical protein
MKRFKLILWVVNAPSGAPKDDVMIKGRETEKSTIFFRTYIYEAEAAAIPFKKSDAETAMVWGKPSNTNRGENISPPPKPTIVRIKEERKIIINKTKRFIIDGFVKK